MFFQPRLFCASVEFLKDPLGGNFRRLGGELLPVVVDFCSELMCAVPESLVEGTLLAPAGAPEKGS